VTAGIILGEEYKNAEEKKFTLISRNKGNLVVQRIPFITHLKTFGKLPVVNEEDFRSQLALEDRKNIFNEALGITNAREIKLLKSMPSIGLYLACWIFFRY